MKTIRCVAFALLGVAFTAGPQADAARPTAHTAAENAQHQLTVVTHLDVARVSVDRALGLLDGYISTSRAESGNVELEVLQQINSPNHFTLVEVWSGRAAYDAHISAAATREFHRQLDPLLSSPHDERLFTDEYH